jgi:hypothetical protein
VFFDTLTEVFKHILLLLLALFSNFEAKCNQNGSKLKKRQTESRDFVWVWKIERKSAKLSMTKM